MGRFLKFFAILAAVALTGCDSPQRTVETLRREIAVYKQNPTPEQEAKVEGEFARLDQQIARLEADNKVAEATSYRSTAGNLRADFRSAKMAQQIRDAQNAIEGIGDAIKDAGRSIGDIFRPTPTPPPDTP